MTRRFRFAPTPSRELHVGNALAAVIGWAAARAVGGQIILRIEDIDQVRCTETFEKACLDDLEWLGLDWDEGPVRQSERMHLYDDALDALAEAGLVYACTCSRAQVRAAQRAPHLSRFFADLGRPRPYPGTCRNANHDQPKDGQGGWRLNVDRLGQRANVSYVDLWQGPQSEDVRSSCGDFMLGRHGMPTYQLASVYDDRAMGVTDVIRGHDLLGSSARQIVLHRVLEHLEPAPRTSVPRFAHHPLIVTSGGEKLSKRDRSISISGLRQDGISPGRLLATVCASVGWIPASTRTLEPRQLVEMLAEPDAPAGFAVPPWDDGTLLPLPESD